MLTFSPPVDSFLTVNTCRRRQAQARVKNMTAGYSYSNITKPPEEVELDEKGRPAGKPWKKHNNKGKKEKIRRTQIVKGTGI